MTKTNIEFERQLELCMPLICKICGNSKIPGYEFEDLRQELSLHLWVCWDQWDPSRETKFFTFVYPALYAYRNMLVRKAKAKMRGGGESPISCNGPKYASQDGEGDGELIEFLYSSNSCCDDPDSYLDRQEIRAAIDSAMASMPTKKARSIVSGLLEGYSQVEMGHKFGCAQSLVNYHYGRFRDALAEELEARGFGRTRN